nr:phage/plasmid primase, P4 family [Corynebacterium ulcerans]
MEPLQILTRLDNSRQAPAWLSKGYDVDPARLVALANGLVDLDTKRLRPHTPKLLNTYALEFDYDPNAACPRWDAFISQVFAHDPKGAEMLQQWFGYVISGDMRQQKLLMLIGSGRNGKGVITRVLQQLMGLSNVVGTNLQNLGSDFGLADLIDKPLAVIGDARLSPKGTETVVQALLSITGQDPLSINRKNKEFWQGTLPTRIMISTNEVPRMLDASGAIVSRCLMLELELSFKGKEDKTLESDLAKELPGIFNWALRGLKSLKKQGAFTVADSMGHLAERMGAYASPVQEFMVEHFEITAQQGDMLPLAQVHRMYKNMVSEQGGKALSQSEFERRVEAACPGVKRVSPRIPGRKRERMLRGIKLLPSSIF